MPANPLYAIRFSPDDRALLATLAAREGLSTQNLIRRALRWYAENVQPAQVKPLKRKAAK